MKSTHLLICIKFFTMCHSPMMPFMSVPKKLVLHWPYDWSTCFIMKSGRVCWMLLKWLEILQWMAWNITVREDVGSKKLIFTSFIFFIPGNSRFLWNVATYLWKCQVHGFTYQNSIILVFAAMGTLDVSGQKCLYFQTARVLSMFISVTVIK
jgi:hypothetical protein